MSEQTPAELGKPLVLFDLARAALAPQSTYLALFEQPMHDVFPRTVLCEKNSVRIFFDDGGNGLSAKGEDNCGKT